MTVEHRPVTAEGLVRIPDHGLGRGLVRGQTPGSAVAAQTGFESADEPDTARAPDVAFVSTTDRFSEVEETVEDRISAGTRMALVVNRAARP